MVCYISHVSALDNSIFLRVCPSFPHCSPSSNTSSTSKQPWEGRLPVERQRIQQLRLWGCRGSTGGRPGGRPGGCRGRRGVGRVGVTCRGQGSSQPSMVSVGSIMEPWSIHPNQHVAIPAVSLFHRPCLKKTLGLLAPKHHPFGQPKVKVCRPPGRVTPSKLGLN